MKKLRLMLALMAALFITTAMGAKADVGTSHDSASTAAVLAATHTAHSPPFVGDIDFADIHTCTLRLEPTAVIDTGQGTVARMATRVNFETQHTILGAKTAAGGFSRAIWIRARDASQERPSMVAEVRDPEIDTIFST